MTTDRAWKLATQVAAVVVEGGPYTDDQLRKVVEADQGMREIEGNRGFPHAVAFQTVEITQISAPVLRPMVDMQDFDGFRFHPVDYNVGQRRNHQLPSAAAVSRSAPIG